MLKKPFPFDPLLKHHLLIALGLAIWIFLFLLLTEPLDTNEITGIDKFIFLPIYGLAGGIAYLCNLPLQGLVYRKNSGWTLFSEILFFLLMTVMGYVLAYGIYRFIVVPGEPNAYSPDYYALSIYLPAIATVLPILAIGRWAFGRYFEKKLEDQKIEIEGEGTYEGLRLQFNDLVSVKADDNYIEISYLNNGLLKKQLIRNKLSKVEIAIPELLRTHRSYLINPNHFQQFKMESGKLNLILSSEISIPVSKTYAEKIKAQFAN